jgi:methanogenic corrinoid protein MtbC1
VGASDDGLTALLRAYGQGASPRGAALPEPELPELLAAVRRYDGLGLGRALLGAWGRLGPLEFVRGCVAPLVTAVGAGWASGELEIRHEHFISERLGDLLRALRLPFEERALGPLVLLTTLPGESHVLGLQMVALLMAAAGCRVLLLGAQTPSEEIIALARDIEARAVGLSISPATASTATARQIGRLRQALPARTGLLVGGEGAPAPARNVTRMTELGAVDDWARHQARAVVG